MPKPNYSFEKRQRELAKKKKKEEKEAEKRARKASCSGTSSPEQGGDAEPIDTHTGTPPGPAVDDGDIPPRAA